MNATVYRAYGKGGRLLYVGCSRDFRHRQAGHRARSRWFSLVDRWEVDPPQPRERALAREAQQIRSLHHPRFNILQSNGASVSTYPLYPENVIHRNGLTSHEVTIRAGITYRQLDHWVRAGYIPGNRRVANTGSGTARDWTNHETRFVVALAQLVKAGIRPDRAAAALNSNDNATVPEEITLPGGVRVVLPRTSSAVPA